MADHLTQQQSERTNHGASYHGQISVPLQLHKVDKLKAEGWSPSTRNTGRSIGVIGSIAVMVVSLG